VCFSRYLYARIVPTKKSLFFFFPLAFAKKARPRVGGYQKRKVWGNPFFHDSEGHRPSARSLSSWTILHERLSLSSDGKLPSTTGSLVPLMLPLLCAFILALRSYARPAALDTQNSADLRVHAMRLPQLSLVLHKYIFLVGRSLLYSISRPNARSSCT